MATSSVNSSSTSSSSDFMSIKQGFGQPASPPSYSALCKAILRYRQKRVYALTLAGIACTLPPATLPIAGFDSFIALLYPTVWFYLGVAFVGTLAVFVARKQFMQTTSRGTKDRASQYIALATLREARWTLFAYFWAAGCLTTALLCIATKLAPERSYLVLYKSPGRDVVSLNERFVYIFLAVLASVAAYGVQQILRARQVLSFPIETTPIPVRLQSRLASQIKTVPTLALSSNITLLGVYLLFKRSFLRFIIYRLPGGRMLRPYLLNMLRVSNLSASLILSSLCVSLASLFILELANSLADVYYSQPITVSTYSADPKRTLINGLQSSDPYIKRFAYIELRQLALSDKSRRIDIFSDIKTRSFDSVSKQCLDQITGSTRTLQQRGEAAASLRTDRVAASSASSSETRAHASASRLPISEESAFRPAAVSMVDRLAQYAGAPDTASSLVPAAITASSTATALEKVPSIFQRRVTELAPPAVKEEASKIRETVVAAEKTVLSRLDRLTPASLRSTAAFRYLFDPLLSPRVARSLPDGADLDICAISSLGALLMASLHEDQYGVAQVDIPKILEALLTYLQSLQNYADELNALAEDKTYSQSIVKEQISTKIQPVVDALRNNIAGIAQTFRPFLSDLKLPPHVAKGVESFL